MILDSVEYAALKTILRSSPNIEEFKNRILLDSLMQVDFVSITYSGPIIVPKHYDLGFGRQLVDLQGSQKTLCVTAVGLHQMAKYRKTRRRNIRLNLLFALISAALGFVISQYAPHLISAVVAKLFA